MESGVLKVLTMTCWWQLAVIMDTKFLHYLEHYSVFQVVVENSFSDTFNLG